MNANFRVVLDACVLANFGLRWWRRGHAGSRPPGLGLKNPTPGAGLHVGLVLDTLLGGELALVAFSGQRFHPRTRPFIRAQSDQRAGCLQPEAKADPAPQHQSDPGPGRQAPGRTGATRLLRVDRCRALINCCVSMKLSLQFLLAALCWLTAGTRSVSAPGAAAPPRGYSIPLLDLAGETNRQVTVDREPGQYLGHPTTVLLEDGKTILCVYPQGHGKGPIMYKRSPDGGLTWGSRLPVPATWATSKETPTIHRVVDAAGKKRLLVWSGLYPARLAVSEDDGQSWSDLRTAGDWGGIVVMGFVEPLHTGPGHYLAMFHDDGRFFSATAAVSKPVTFTLYQNPNRDAKSGFLPEAGFKVALGWL